MPLDQVRKPVLGKRTSTLVSVERPLISEGAAEGKCHISFNAVELQGGIED